MYQNGYSMTIATMIISGEDHDRRDPAAQPGRLPPADRGRPDGAAPGRGAGGRGRGVERGGFGGHGYQPSPSSGRISRSWPMPTMIMMTNRMIPYSAPVPNWP